MKTSSVIIIIVLLIIIGGGLYYLNSNSSMNPTNNVIQTSTSTEAPTSTSTNTSAAATSTSTASSTTRAMTASVDIRNFAFSPVSLTVKKGTKVTWENYDSAPHTVTSVSGNELASQQLTQGKTYSHTFNTVGTFDYHCTIHPNMKASVVVTP